MTAWHEITQRDLRGRSGDIMDAVERGESFVVTRNGNPIGELIPLRRRRTVTREQFVALSAAAPDIDLARFRADLDRAADDAVHDPATLSGSVTC
jgi:prevent-host-death family protein